MTLAIADWSRDHENERSLRMAQIHLAIDVNRHDTDLHRAVIAEPDGALLRGCWCWMVDLAGRSPLRGALLTQRGTAHDATSMAAAVGGQVGWFTRAIDFFLRIERLLRLSFNHEALPVPCGTGVIPGQFVCQLPLPQMLADGWVAYDAAPSRARARRGARDAPAHNARARAPKKEEKPPSESSSHGGRRPRAGRGQAPDAAEVALFAQAHGISLGQLEAWSLERASAGWVFPSGRNWKQDLWRWRGPLEETQKRDILPFETRNPPEVVQACLREMRARAAQGGAR